MMNKTSYQSQHDSLYILEQLKPIKMRYNGGSSDEEGENEDYGTDFCKNKK